MADYPHKCVPFYDPRLNHSEEIRPKSHRSRLFRPFFSNFDKCRADVVGDVLSGAALANVGVDIPAKAGDSRLNSG